MTYYDILEVSEKASQEVIRMAYKALCKKYHPDVYQGDKSFAEEQMKKINEAYETLSDETKKRQYDYSLNIQSQPKQNTYYEPKPQEPRYQPRQEDRTYNIKSLLELGFDMLKNGNRFQADRIFDQVLAKERNNAEAYLGKLMVELGVKNRNSLKNCRKPFNDKPNYQKALLYADNSLKEFLIGTIQHINKRNYETECQNTYRKACAFMLRNDGIQCFQDAIAEFEKIRGYKDSNQRIEKCYQKIAEIKSATLAAEAEKEKQKEERKEKIKASLPLFKKIAMFVVPLLVLEIIATTVLPKIDWNGENATSIPSDDETSNATTSENISGEDSSSFVSSEQANNVSSPTINSSSTSNQISSPSSSTSIPSNNTSSSNTPSTSKPSASSSQAGTNSKPSSTTSTSSGATSKPSSSTSSNISTSTELKLVTDQAKILKDAFALGKNETTPYIAQLEGKVISIDKEYSDQYGSVTVTMTVGGKNIVCYNMKVSGVSGGSKVKAGDTITVQGVIKNFYYDVNDASGKVKFTYDDASQTEVILKKLVVGKEENKTLSIVDVPVVGTAYKFGFVSTSSTKGGTYYATGGMNGYYMATTTSVSAAIDVYVEKSGDGYYLYTMIDGKKKYMNIKSTGTHVDAVFEDAPGVLLKYDTAKKTLVVNAVKNGEEDEYAFGTWGDYFTIGTTQTSKDSYFCHFYK